MFTHQRLKSVLGIMVLFLLCLNAVSEIPQMISYQGKITDSGGNPIADGTYTIRFYLYSQETGGSVVWDSGNLPIPVSSGVFCVLLGDGNPITIDFADDCWLEVVIEGDTQTPRQQLGSVGYAYMASGLVPGTEVSGSVTTGTNAALKTVNTSVTGTRYGLYGQSSSPNGYGIYGYNASGWAGGFDGDVDIDGRLEVAEFDASGTPGSGAIEIGSSLRLDNNEIITNDGTTLYLQHNNNGDLRVDQSTFFVDASANEVGIGTTNPGAKLDVQSDGASSTVIRGETSAVSGQTRGVVGRSSSATDEAAGVFGESTASTGKTWGGRFVTSSDQGSAVSAWASSGSGETKGGSFHSGSTAGIGCFGKAWASSGVNYGVYGQVNSPDGYGVYGSGPTVGIYGTATSTSEMCYAGRFVTDSPTGFGVYCEARNVGVQGQASATTGTSYGGLFLSASPDGRGVYGQAQGYGVYGACSSSTGYAGYFQGNARVTGNLTVDGTLTGPGIGDITAVNAGTGLNGGGTSGNVTLHVDVPLSLSNAGVDPTIKGINTSTSGSRYGVYGESTSSGGAGIYGRASAMSGESCGGRFWNVSNQGTGVSGFSGWTGTGTTYGGRFESSSSSGRGVYGAALQNSGVNYGVYGRSNSSSGSGVYGISRIGVMGESDYVGGTGVHGYAPQTSGTTYGVTGMVESSTGWAGYFFGDVFVNGTLSKADGSFVIDHPLDPENKLLRHKFVESPEDLLIYRGSTTLNQAGMGKVAMPDYFVSLAKEDEATVHLTPRGKSSSPNKYEFSYEWDALYQRFEIYGEPGRTVAWMVMANRDDPVIRRLERRVEEEKGSDNPYCDKGTLLFPEAYGYPISRGKAYQYKEMLGHPKRAE